MSRQIAPRQLFGQDLCARGPESAYPVIIETEVKNLIILGIRIETAWFFWFASSLKHLCTSVKWAGIVVSFIDLQDCIVSLSKVEVKRVSPESAASLWVILNASKIEYITKKAVPRKLWENEASGK